MLHVPLKKDSHSRAFQAERVGEGGEECKTPSLPTFLEVVGISTKCVGKIS